MYVILNNIVELDKFVQWIQVIFENCELQFYDNIISFEINSYHLLTRKVSFFLLSLNSFFGTIFGTSNTTSVGIYLAPKIF